MNRLNRYRVEFRNDFREIRDDIRDYRNDVRYNYNNFRQNWRHQIPIDYDNMRRAHAQAFNRGRGYVGRGFGQGRDFLGRNILGDDYNHLRCVQNRNLGDSVLNRNRGNEWGLLYGRGPFMTGALPYHSPVWTLE